jgi:RimJ/RimL family protein N-acetyltransferase
MILKVKWYNDPAVRKTLVVDEVFEINKTMAWFSTLEFNENRVDFMVETLDQIPIGITGLIDIDSKNKTSQCYCVIGEKEYWARGLGTEIHSVLFQWAFQSNHIEKIWADIRTNNPAIFKVVEKLGFKIEGTLRREKIVDGQRIDLYRIGLLHDEFNSAHIHYELKLQAK